MEKLNLFGIFSCFFSLDNIICHPFHDCIEFADLLSVLDDGPFVHPTCVHYCVSNVDSLVDDFFSLNYLRPLIDSLLPDYEEDFFDNGDDECPIGGMDDICKTWYKKIVCNCTVSQTCNLPHSHMSGSIRGHPLNAKNAPNNQRREEASPKKTFQSVGNRLWIFQPIGGFQTNVAQSTGNQPGRPQPGVTDGVFKKEKKLEEAVTLPKQYPGNSSSVPTSSVTPQASWEYLRQHLSQPNNNQASAAMETSSATGKVSTPAGIVTQSADRETCVNHKRPVNLAESGQPSFETRFSNPDSQRESTVAAHADQESMAAGYTDQNHATGKLTATSNSVDETDASVDRTMPDYNSSRHDLEQRFNESSSRIISPVEGEPNLNAVSANESSTDKGDIQKSDLSATSNPKNDEFITGRHPVETPTSKCTFDKNDDTKTDHPFPADSRFNNNNMDKRPTEKLVPPPQPPPHTPQASSSHQSTPMFYGRKLNFQAPQSVQTPFRSIFLNDEAVRKFFEENAQKRA